MENINAMQMERRRIKTINVSEILSWNTKLFFVGSFHLHFGHEARVEKLLWAQKGGPEAVEGLR